MPDLPSHFGPYQILSPLGAGGMGQVYRARDTRLLRAVAIKVLHDGASRDPDRQRRFAQEAVAASALNHPNILTVYDVGADGDAHFLVSELIEGESLRAEMNRGRVPLKRVIEIALQIAEGLAAAHEAGIVHRDLKPENVMVTPDGHVKIVDFGLAKAADDAADGGESGPDDTFTATETVEGLIMGTVPYLSPEQARGGTADFRSDQFALGVILYELTTAKHPFTRQSAVQTLSAIIGDEPPDPAQMTPALPVAVRWLIRRLLSKNPRQRFASTSDLAADLRTIRDYLAEATSSGVIPFVPPPRPRWWLRPAIGALIVTNIVVVLWALNPSDAGPHFDRYTPFATDAGYQGSPVWSPDGKQIAYDAEVEGIVQVFTRSIDSSARAPVTNRPNDCYVSAWSSDGYIYFHTRVHDGDGLFRVSPVGGTPEPVLENASRSAISPDGKTVFYLRDSDGAEIHFDLWSASLPDAEGTKQRFLRGAFKNITASSSGHLKFSPDGSKLLLWLGPGPGGNPSIWQIPLPDGEPRHVLSALITSAMPPLSFSWVDNRQVVLTRADGPSPGDHLWLADTETNRVVSITSTPATNERSPSVSPSGHTIATTVDATDFDLIEIPLDGSNARPVIKTTRNEFDPAVSPTAEAQYAFVTDRTGDPQIWLQNQSDSKPFVTAADFDGVPSLAIGALAFSPDGTRLAFQAAVAPESTTLPGFGGGSRVWVKSIAGGKPFPIGGSETFQDAPTWSPHSDWIAYLSSGKGERVALVKSRVGDRGVPIRLTNDPIPPFVVRPRWSPDGDWILCETFEGLSIIAADGSQRSQVIAETGWLAYTWDTDGRRVYGLLPSDDSRQFTLVSIDLPSGKRRVINEHLGPIPQALQSIRGFSRVRSGGLLTSIAHVRSDIYLIEGFQLPRAWWERVWGLRRAPQP
jgi:serine/threonine protein kinase